MRYRLMASYLGASYQAAVGPSDRDVTLFAAPPPPEEHGFSPAPGGIWRKQVWLNDIDALWESRPVGSYHGEPCLVLDDQGDRLHIAYLGMDERRADQLGYWQVDRGVFEVVVPRQEVADLAEERHEFRIALVLSALPWGRVPGSHQQPPASAQLPPGGAQQPLMGARQLPAAASQAAGPQQLPGAQQLPVRPQLPNPPPPASAAAWHGSPAADSNGAWYYQDGAAAQNGTQPHGGPASAGPAGLPAGYGNGPQDSYRQFAAGPPQAPPNGVASSAAYYSPPAPQPGQAFLPAQQPQPAQPQASQPQPVLPQAGQPPQPVLPHAAYSPRLSQQPHSAPLPQSAQLAQPMPLASPAQPSQPFQTAPPGQTAPQARLPASQVQAAPQVQPGAAALAPQGSAMGPAQAAPAVGAHAETAPTDPLMSLPSMPQPSQASQPSQQAQAAPATQPSALSKLTGAVRGRRAARKPRLAMSAVFADLVDMAAIPRSAYAVDEEVTGAMCLFKTEGGYEVFSCAEDARHEVRFFEEEEAAYFYLFGVLAAEALRNGRLTPRRG